MLYERRSLKRILTEGTQLYCANIARLTQPYVLPLLLQGVGVALWIILSYQSIEWTTAWPVGWRWAVFAASNVLGMGLFVRGFWNYLVWFSALNLLIRDVVDGNPVLDGRAYTLRVTNRSMDYSLVWLFLFAAFFVPVGLAAVPAVFGGMYPQWAGLFLLLSGAVFIIGPFSGAVLTLFCAMVFQTFVFQPASAGACLFRGAGLVRLNGMKVFAVSLMALIATQYAIPALTVWGFDLTHITSFLGATIMKPVVLAMQFSARQALEFPQDYPAFLVSVYRLILQNPGALTLELVRCTVYTIAGALAIPLGTCWFMLLYGDLKTKKDNETSGQAVFVSQAGQSLSTADS